MIEVFTKEGRLIMQRTEFDGSKQMIIDVDAANFKFVFNQTRYRGTYVFDVSYPDAISSIYQPLEDVNRANHGD